MGTSIENINRHTKQKNRQVFLIAADFYWCISRNMSLVNFFLKKGQPHAKMSMDKILH